MYKKKTPATLPIPSVYTPYIAVIVTVVVMLLLEYFISFPSNWIHDPSGENPSTENNIRVCNDDIAPVCGKDGVTYVNSCFAKLADVTVARVGSCSPEDGDAVQVPTDLEEYSEENINTSSGDVLISSSTGLFVSGEVDLKKYTVYTSNAYKYTLVLPKYAYFQGSVTPDKKGHRLSIGFSEAEIADPDTAPIRVTFLPKGMTPPAGTQTTFQIENGTISISYEGSLSIKAKEIIETIKASARSI